MASHGFIVKKGLLVSSADASNSATSGAIVTQGGVGIGGNLNAAGIITSANSQVLTYTSIHTGTAILDFGAFPGSSIASVDIVGQSAIDTSSRVRLYISGDSVSADHTAPDHMFFQCFASTVAGNIIPNVGFTIYGTTLHQLQGQWVINWEWI